MWYVIRTETGREEYVKQQIKRRMSGVHLDDCKVLYRMCKKRYQGVWHEKMEVFLPGYLFLVAKDSSLELKNIREILTIEDAVRYGEISNSGEMRLVGEDEEAFFKRITRLGREKDKVEMSYGVIRNGILEISEGAMVGMEDRLRKIDRHKRKGYVSVWLDGKERIAEIGLEITEKIYSMGNISGLKNNCIKDYATMGSK